MEARDRQFVSWSLSTQRKKRRKNVSAAERVGDVRFSVVPGSVLVRAWRDTREPGRRAWQRLAGGRGRGQLYASEELIGDMRLVAATAPSRSRESMCCGMASVCAARGTRYLSAFVGVHHIGRVGWRTACPARHKKHKRLQCGRQPKRSFGRHVTESVQNK